MKIGIIGSGKVGGTLTLRLRALGHQVTVANSRGPQSLGGLTAETGAVAGTVPDATMDADLVVLAVPLRAVPDLPADAFRGKIVVDADNYYPQRDGNIEPVSGKSATSSGWTADMLPGATVIKAFNTIMARHLLENGRPAGDPDRVALPVAGDDAEAKRLVMGLIDDLGFDSVDAGPLDESWRQEPDSLVFIRDWTAEGVREGLRAAKR
jgi:8-hydroxy-5-deazaflavin:NADPH oxidoreductase